MNYEPKDRREQIRGWLWYYASCLSTPWWVRYSPGRAAMYRARLDYWLTQAMPKAHMDSLKERTHARR